MRGQIGGGEAVWIGWQDGRCNCLRGRENALFVRKLDGWKSEVDGFPGRLTVLRDTGVLRCVIRNQSLGTQVRVGTLILKLCIEVAGAASRSLRGC